MRFSYQIGMCDPAHYLPLAKAAEEAGFHGITVPDSICYPKESSSTYPYNADGSRHFLETEPFMESLIAVSAMAAVTERIRFATFVYKLAIRQVACVAKQVQSINHLSGNRFDLGVGISPWKEDFDVTGMPFEKRGQRLDEQIATLRGLDSGDYFGFEGELINMPEIKMNPAPTAPTSILVGGHADPALRRAARNDGWMCAGASLDELREYVGKLNGYREEQGTADRPFRVFTTGQDAFTPEGIRELEDIGITDVIIAFRNVYEQEPDHDLDTKLKQIQWYAGEFISS